MDWTGKRVMVTGGSGVIGRELLRRLSERGALVRSVDKVPLDGAGLTGVEALTADLVDADLAWISELDPHVIFHLAAAFERTREEPEFWERNFRNNVIVSHRVVEAAWACPSLDTFVFASSYLVYSPDLYLFERPPERPRQLAETDAVAPRNLCGAAKFYTENELRTLATTGRCRTVSARIYRVYGLGSRDVISRWVNAAMAGRAIEVYGRENRFDFIYAGDVAEALVRLAESRTATGPVNVGSGRATTVQEVLDALRAFVPNLQVCDVEVREPVEASVAHLPRLRSVTGWVPVTTVAGGVRLLVAARRGGGRAA